jgi:transposase
VLSICHSERSGSKVSQKVLKYIGSAHTDEQYAVLLKVAQSELKALKTISKEPLTKQAEDDCDDVRLSELIDKGRIIEGFHDVCGILLDRIGISTCFTNYRYKQLKDVVLARIAHPSSKLRTAQILTENFHRSITENQIYRLMDELLCHKDEIVAKIFEFSKHLSEKQTIDLLLFDVTTLYFESQKADDLRNFGYSKDHKIGEVQIVLALATTSKGLPIGYHIFSGNTAETGTLLKSLDAWREQFTIGEVVVIADRAMMSDDNLLKMESAQLKYIVAARLRSLPKKLKEQILARKNETPIDVLGDQVHIQEQKYKERRLVIGFSHSRAKKDRDDRERLIGRLKSKLGKNGADSKKLITNRGYLKFTDEKQESKFVLNEEKIVQDMQWDGLHGIITNDHLATPQRLLELYRRLWIIEESFRINKHTLEMRPIYHFTTKRIEAHILICYISFALLRFLQNEVKAFDESLSIEKIRNSLFSVQSSILENESNGRCYRIPSNLNGEVKTIYRALGIKRGHAPSRWREKENVVPQ